MIDPTELFPADFVERMGGLLQEELDSFLEALAVRTVGLRVNELRLDPAGFEAISPFSMERLPFPPGGYALEGEVARPPAAPEDGPATGGGESFVGGEAIRRLRPGKHPYHAAGLYYLQDPGAMVVGALVDARPGERVLDLSAAPGGKATHLASLMRGEGVLVANDVSAARARELAGNLERMGVRNAIVTNETPERLADWFGPWFDRVLVDAPCSGESMFCKSEVARRDWSRSVVEGCARRQTELIRAAARLVKPGGLLFYSTCTFSPEENEGAIAEFLSTADGFEVVSLDGVPGARPGRGDWLSGGAPGLRLERTLRLWPHLVPGAGHYIAGLRRDPDERVSPGPPLARAGAGRQARMLLEGFREDVLKGQPFGDRIAEQGSELYALPQGAPETGPLRVLRRGWWLGTVLKNRFHPAHALAVALTAAGVREAVVLNAADPDTLAYLRGQTISARGPAGWTLVSVEGFALGWGKRVGNTVKNHLPKGLRWH